MERLVFQLEILIKSGKLKWKTVRPIQTRGGDINLNHHHRIEWEKTDFRCQADQTAP